MRPVGEPTCLHVRSLLEEKVTQIETIIQDPSNLVQFSAISTASSCFRGSSTLVELPVQKLIARGFNTCQASGELKVSANSEHLTLARLDQDE